MADQSGSGNTLAKTIAFSAVTFGIGLGLCGLSFAVNKGQEWGGTLGCLSAVLLGISGAVLAVSLLILLFTQLARLIKHLTRKP